LLTGKKKPGRQRVIPVCSWFLNAGFLFVAGMVNSFAPFYPILSKTEAVSYYYNPSKAYFLFLKTQSA